MTRFASPESLAGMAWWNSQTQHARRSMLAEIERRGEIPTPARCWEVFGSGVSENQNFSVRIGRLQLDDLSLEVAWQAISDAYGLDSHRYWRRLRWLVAGPSWFLWSSGEMEGNVWDALYRSPDEMARAGAACGRVRARVRRTGNRAHALPA